MMIQEVTTRLNRRAAADYLQTRHGLPTTAASLAKLACVGGGPAYHKIGSRTVLYETNELDRWALEKLGKPLRSTSDAA